MKFYHATDIKNLSSILGEGIRPGVDGIVYLAKAPEHALRFVFLKAVALSFDVLVLEVDLKEEEVFETFDHSFNFFRAKSFGYTEIIPISRISDYSLHHLVSS